MRDAFALIWVCVGLGWLVRRAGLLGAEAERALSRFVYLLAMPAALFVRVAEAGVDSGGLAAAAVVTCACLPVAAVGYWVSGRWFGRARGERVIAGMAAGYLNSANLGLPVALHLLGGSTVVVGVIAAQVLVLTPAILVLLERHEYGGRPPWRRLATLPLRNPVILGCALGAACGQLGWQPPASAQQCLATLGAAAVPTALVALGLSLAERTGTGAAERRELGVIAALKLVGQPVLAYALGRFAFGLAGPDLYAAVVFAGLPTAQATFVVASEYRTAPRLAARAVAGTTAAAMLTIWLTTLLLR